MKTWLLFSLWSEFRCFTSDPFSCKVRCKNESQHKRIPKFWMTLVYAKESHKFSRKITCRSDRVQTMAYIFFRKLKDNTGNFQKQYFIILPIKRNTWRISPLKQCSINTYMTTGCRSLVVVLSLSKRKVVSSSPPCQT
jgi:hypothetical protein